MPYLIAPAIIATIAGLIMMTPQMRRRAAERGLSGSLEVPALITGIGLICMVVGFLL